MQNATIYMLQHLGSYYFRVLSLPTKLQHPAIPTNVKNISNQSFSQVAAPSANADGNETFQCVNSQQLPNGKSNLIGFIYFVEN